MRSAEREVRNERLINAALFRIPKSELEIQKSQGDHGGCGANCRCCLPALAGFVSPHSMGPGKIRVEAMPRWAASSSRNTAFGRSRILRWCERIASLLNDLGAVKRAPTDDMSESVKVKIMASVDCTSRHCVQPVKSLEISHY